MAETTFKPSEAAITKVLEKYSPRQVAIAYLKATLKHLERCTKAGRTHKETGEA